MEISRLQLIFIKGDGANDFCPMMRLPKKDGIALPRKNYSIVRHIAKHEAKGLKIQAAIIKEWETITDITDIISNFINSNKS